MSTVTYSKQNIVGECFCVFYYANMLLSWVFVHKSCIRVQMCLGYQDGQACIVTKHHWHVSFISSITGIHAYWNVHVPTYRGLCWDTVSNISLLYLQLTSCRNLTTQQYTAIGETQLNEQGTFEHGLFSNVNIFQCGAMVWWRMPISPSRHALACSEQVISILLHFVSWSTSTQ